MSGRATLLAVIATAIAAFAMILAAEWLTYRHDERMAELGYQQEMIPGSSCPQWRKCR